MKAKYGLAADVFDGAPGFYRFQNGDGLIPGEANFTYGGLFREHNQYAGTSLKENGADCRDTYRYTSSVLAQI